MQFILMKNIGNQKPFLILISLILSLTASVATSAVSADDKTAVDDKIDDFFLRKCPGIISTDSSIVETDSEVDIKADDTVISKEGKVSFKGNIQLMQGSNNLTADLAELDAEGGQLTASGNIRYQDPQIRLTSDDIQLDFKQQTGRIKNTKFQLIKGSMRGEASLIQIQNKNAIKLTDVGITSCPPGKESWLFETSQISIDTDKGRGVAQDVLLKINDVPVFYFPTISFPVDDKRHSGFLYPSLGTSSRNGIAVSAPWYWNIAPDKDATFSARYLSLRGTMLSTEYRQLTENSETEFFAEYLGNDKRALDGVDERYFYKLDSDYSSGENWRGNIDYSSVSDDGYFYDFGANYTSGNRNYLKRSGKIGFDDAHLSFSGLISDDLLLSTPIDSYSRLPQLRLSFLYPEYLAGLTTNLHLEVTAFRHDSAVEAERLMLIPEFEYPITWSSGYIKPRLKWHHSQYSQDDPGGVLPESISRSLPIFSIDSGMVFERNMEISEESFIQTLEPRLFYLYVPTHDQSDIALFDTTDVNNGVDSLFRENRYTGEDRIGDSNQVSLAITSRFYEQNSGRERMRLTIGRAYYLDDREVNLAVSSGYPTMINSGIDSSRRSELITNLQVGIYERWQLEGEIEYDDRTHRTDKGVIGLQYKNNGRVFNMRHRYNRFSGIDAIEQAEVSFSWQANADLAFVARWQQDIRNNRTIDSFAGLEYESCCWAMRLVARRYLNLRLDQFGSTVPGTDEYNTGIYLEFILKGLTNIGNSLNLDRDIQGYEDRFKNY